MHNAIDRTFSHTYIRRFDCHRPTFVHSGDIPTGQPTNFRIYACLTARSPYSLPMFAAVHRRTWARANTRPTHVTPAQNHLVVGMCSFRCSANMGFGCSLRRQTIADHRQVGMPAVLQLMMRWRITVRRGYTLSRAIVCTRHLNLVLELSELYFSHWQEV